MDTRKQHWENIYSKKSDTEVSWFQENPEKSLQLIDKYAAGNTSVSVADIGGGNSLLVAALLKRAFTKISVLDISANALQRSRNRVGESSVTWIECSVLECNQLRNIDLWHDRAVFHFLTNEMEIKQYVARAEESIKSGGYLILATFSETGPEKCSGLPVTQYSEAKFKKCFSESFKLIECFDEVHTTPFNTTQNFVWVVFKRK